jgi:hypothetical protein
VICLVLQSQTSSATVSRYYLALVISKLKHEILYAKILSIWNFPVQGAYFYVDAVYVYEMSDASQLDPSTEYKA